MSDVNKPNIISRYNHEAIYNVLPYKQCHLTSTKEMT